MEKNNVWKEEAFGRVEEKKSRILCEIVDLDLKEETAS